MTVVELYRGGGTTHFLFGWRWRLVAGNGEIVAQSEAYVTKWNAKRSARKLFPEFEIRDLTK